MRSHGLSKKYSVRVAQAIQQFGTGAMIDFPNQTLMTAAPKYWNNGAYEIHDERLESVLGVNKFCVPSSTEEGCNGISYVRFPEWYFCPKCRRIQSLKKWINEHNRFKPKSDDENMMRRLRCYKCNRDLVVSRFVSVCERGHIDDFPWIEWAHIWKGSICNSPDIYFKVSSNATEGMGGLEVFCATCNSKNDLSKAFNPTILEQYSNSEKNNISFECKGRHPWKNSKEPCSCFPRIQQRGGSSVYFSNVESSLSIPPFSSKITQKVVANENYSRFITVLDDVKSDSIMFKNSSEGFVTKYAQKISDSTGIDVKYIIEVLKRKLGGDTESKYVSTYSIDYRIEEYTALNGTAPSMASVKCDDNFVREGTDIKNYNLPGIKGIHLIKRLREIRVLTGFSRLSPVNAHDGSEGFVSIIDKNDEWYPAYEIRGEGIFIEFDSACIRKWQSNNQDISDRINLLIKNKKKSNFGFNKNKRITPKFVLLHTLAHLLIKQMSYECGYDISSLRERIYCSEKDEGEEMQGILIYTANGDSEGTLGGLVRLGYSDVFPGIFRKAVDKAVMCSNDPICSLSDGQGLDSLNISACYACALIPETSCEEYNIFLDRAVVVGSAYNHMSGMYSKNTYSEKGWYADFQNDNTVSDSFENSEASIGINITKEGVQLTRSDYEDLWNDLSVETSDENEKKLLMSLHNIKDKFSLKECPRGTSDFVIDGKSETYTCDLIWIKSRVMYFSAAYEDDYNAALKSDWTCFCGSDRSLSVAKILGAIKE